MHNTYLKGGNILDFENYYENVGTKIKKLSQIIGIVVSIIFIIPGIILEFVFEFEFCGLFILGGIVSAIINYLYSWFLYAFGQITDDI